MNKLCLFACLLMPAVVNAQLAPNYVRPRLPNETPAPTVVFVGDYVTAEWASAFAANPNWINKGVSIPMVSVRSSPLERLGRVCDRCPLIF
jgi:hypothetical protein